MFTPSTKATEGHDINISYDEAVDIVGPDLAEQARLISLEAYTRASEHAARSYKTCFCITFRAFLDMVR